MKLFFHKACVFGCTEGKFVCTLADSIANSFHYTLCTRHEKIRQDTGSRHFFHLKVYVSNWYSFRRENPENKYKKYPRHVVYKSRSAQEGSQKKPPSIQPKNQTYI